MILRASLVSLIVLSACKPKDPTCAQRDKEVIRWYLDEDRDGYGNASNVLEDCEDVDGNGPQGYVVDDTDCDDLRPAVYPTAPELCDGLDNNCNVAIDDGLVYNEFWLDQDGDGFGDPNLLIAACDAPEGAALQPGDCNDGDALINPDVVEICDTIDNDCDGLTDDEDHLPLAEGGVDLEGTGLTWYPDSDGDSYGSWIDELAMLACEAPDGHVADNTDCNDADMEINTDNTEVCNMIDDDCDQLYDESDPDLDASSRTEFFIDSDADGYGDPAESIFTCTSPWYYSETDDDCDDDDGDIWNATETVWLLDADGDGFGAGDASHPSCTAPGSDWVPQAAGIDCVDDNEHIHPDAVEICDTIDNDCDELIDDEDLATEEGGVDITTMTRWWADGDGDGFGDPGVEIPACEQPTGMVQNAQDCNDLEPHVNPTIDETCNGIDDDCDFLIDDLDDSLDVDSGTLWVEDLDEDGWGNLDSVVRACIAPFGYIDRYGDCDDTDPFLSLPSTWWLDADGDGQGAGEVVAPATCLPPSPVHVPHYIDSEEDCDPADPLRTSGVEICYDGIDQGCDGNDFSSDGDCELDLPEACEQALLFNPIIPGHDPIVISGTLADAVDDFDPEDPDHPRPHFCTGRQASSPDEVVPITVPDGANLQVSLVIQAGDAAVYLLASCDSTDTCLAGADISTANGGIERVQWQNTTGATTTVYAVLDGDDFTDARPYTVTIELLP